MKRTYFLAVILILFSGCKKESLTENIVINTAQKQEDMALPVTNITTGMVRNELGESTNNVGELCTSGKINPWSPKKPVHIDGTFTKIHGLYYNSNKTIYYKSPLGGAASPYRLGDFRGYNHDSKPPIIFELIEVRLVSGSEVPTMVSGGEYSVKYRFKRGPINPASISEETTWTRPVGDGFGGIMILHAGIVGEVDDSQVFSVESDWTTIETVIITQDSMVGGPPLNVKYMKKVDGKWMQSGYNIESQSDFNEVPRWWHNFNPIAVNCGRVSNPIDDQGYNYVNGNYFFFRYIHTDAEQFFNDGWTMFASAWADPFGRVAPYSVEIRTSIDGGETFGNWEANDLVEGVTEYYYSPINNNDYWLEYGTVYEFRMFFPFTASIVDFRFGLFRNQGLPNAFNTLNPYNPRGDD